ncbi:MAG: LysM peptidoglycan-binding domain-containing protein [Chloroflexi bacterium]|nr:LysM peptidoglycan-binding domain-containing protein [Chloroflexota bacterium]
MMNRQMILRVTTLVTLLLLAVSVVAIEVTTTVAQDATPAVPFADSPPPDIITQLPADARAASCNAFQLPNFTPYVVRPGDTLPMLLASSTALTVTQAAALNCLDDPYALPVGAVIFLPARQDERETAAEPGGDAAAIVAFAAEAETVRNTEGAAFSWSGTGDAAYFFPAPSMSTPCAHVRQRPSLFRSKAAPWWTVSPTPGSIAMPWRSSEPANR